MAGIVAALEADDRVGAAGQPVDDLALALVAPLRPDDGNICHDAVLLNRTLKQVARARLGLSGFGRRGKGGGCWRKRHGAWGGVGGRDYGVRRLRSQARRLGKECVSTCGSPWTPVH